MIFTKIISTITSITNKLEKCYAEYSAATQTSSQSPNDVKNVKDPKVSDVRNVRKGNAQGQPSKPFHGSMCFVHAKQTGTGDQLVSRRFRDFHSTLADSQGSIEIRDLPSELRRGIPERNYRYFEPKGYECGVLEEGGSIDPCEDLRPKDEAPSVDQKTLLGEPKDVFDIMTRLSIKQPTFQRQCIGVYNPFAAGAAVGGDFIRSQLVAVEDQTKSDVQASLPSEVVEPVISDELPPVYEDEFFGEAEDESFVAEDSFQAPDGTTVYISQNDDSDELEELIAA